MRFNLGDSVVHKEFPKSKVVFHLTDSRSLEVINAQSENFRHATEQEIEEWFAIED